jgi:hypothetical protein
MEIIQHHFVAMVFLTTALIYWRLLERSKSDESWMVVAMIIWIATPFGMIWALPLVSFPSIAAHATASAHAMWWAMIPALALAFPGDTREKK